jgi:hypothetical protein
MDKLDPNMTLCESVHCFNLRTAYCSVIFTKPSDSKSYNLCRDCYSLLLNVTERLFEKEIIKPR